MIGGIPVAPYTLLPTTYGVNADISAAHVKLVDEFVADFKAILGAYFDGCEGYEMVEKETIRFQEHRKKHPIKGNTRADPDEVTEWLADNHLSFETYFYKSTLGEKKKRNKEGGPNAQAASCMSIVFLFHVWEEKYRKRFAHLFSIADTRLLQSDCFGDLRNLRNAIIHNHRVATKQVEQNKVFKWFREGQAMSFERGHFKALSKYLHNEFLKQLQCSISRANPNINFVTAAQDSTEASPPNI